MKSEEVINASHCDCELPFYAAANKVTVDVVEAELTSKMGRGLFVGLSIALAAVIANFLAPFFDAHSEQDNCTFGPISNADYSAYVASAKAHLVVRPSFYLDERGFAAKLNDLFERLSREEDSIYARLAIMHAILRAAGAEYRNTNGNHPDRGRSDPFLLATTGAPTVSFNYLLDVNRIWIFSPWPREAWVVGVLAGPLYAQRPGPMYPKGIGGMSFVVNAPDLKMWPHGYEQRPNGSCPPVPDADSARRFLNKTQ
jgi:hypothetical protein